MSRKRDHSYDSQRHSSPKRSRAAAAATQRTGVSSLDVSLSEEDNSRSSNNQSSLVVVSGLSTDCTVLELKSRFQMFGNISRLRIDQGLRFGYITYRSRDSAEAAIGAAMDPGIFIKNKQVQVSWATDPLPQWKLGVAVSSDKDHRPSSKLLRSETPLGRHGRGNNNKKLGSNVATPRNESDSPFKGREVVAYDDIL